MPICFKCQANLRDESISIRLEKVINLSDAINENVKPMFRHDVSSISLDFVFHLPLNITSNQLKEIHSLALNNSGEERLVLIFKDTNKIYKMYSPYKINDNFKDKIHTLIA